MKLIPKGNTYILTIRQRSVGDWQWYLNRGGETIKTSRTDTLQEALEEVNHAYLLLGEVSLIIDKEEAND
jgi:hypothetical protein